VRNEKAVVKTTQRTTQVLTLKKKPASVIIRTRGVEPRFALLQKWRPEDIVHHALYPSGITQRALDYLRFPTLEPRDRVRDFLPHYATYPGTLPMPNTCASKIEGKSMSSVFSFDWWVPALLVIPPSWHTLV
jgi:hypothetical protein